MHSFVGTVSLPNHDAAGLESSLRIDQRELTLSCSLGELGRWGLDKVSGTRTSQAEFELMIDGELIYVKVDRPEEFSSVLGLGSTPVPKVEQGRRGPRESRAERFRSNSLGKLVLGLVAAGMILVVAVAKGEAALDLVARLARSLSPGQAASVDERTATGVGTTLPEFKARWNDAAGALQSPLTIGSFSLQAGGSEDAFQYSLTDDLFVQGSVRGSDGNVQRVMVLSVGGDAADPEAVAAWRLLVATVQPSLTEEERMAVLAELGLSGNPTDLSSLGGASVRGNLIFEVEASPEAGAILLKVTDASPVPGSTG